MKNFKLLSVLLISPFFLACNNESKVEPLTFLNNEFIFGDSKTGGEMVTFFKFKVNKDGVEIKNTGSDCGCSKVIFNEKKVLNKNDVDSIKVVYDSSIKGRFVRRVYIGTNDKEDRYTLYIKGAVFD